MQIVSLQYWFVFPFIDFSGLVSWYECQPGYTEMLIFMLKNRLLASKKSASAEVRVEYSQMLSPSPLSVPEKQHPFPWCVLQCWFPWRWILQCCSIWHTDTVLKMQHRLAQVESLVGTVYFIDLCLPCIPSLPNVLSACVNTSWGW